MIIDSPVVSGSLTSSGPFTEVGNVTISGSLTVTGGVIMSGSIASASQATSASYANSASYSLSSSYASLATTASYATVATSASYADAFTVKGTLTAQTLVVQTITSSVDYITGSSINGSSISNTHQFTGSVQTSGSAYFLGNMSIGGSTLTGYKLQLQGSPGADVIFSISSSGAAAPYIYMDGTLNSYNAIRFRHSGSDYFAMGAVNGNITNNLSFYYNGYSSVAMSISSSGAFGGNIHTGYALYTLGSTGTYNSSAVSTMAIEASFAGVNNVGTLSWSGTALQYTPSRASNYDGYVVIVEWGANTNNTTSPTYNTGIFA